MRCQACRSVIDFPGQVHACRVPGASVADLAVATRRVVGSAVVFAVALVLTTGLARIGPWVAGDVTGVSWLTIAVAVAGLVALGAVLALLVSAGVWVVLTWRLSKRHGTPAYGQSGFWGLGIFAVSVVVPGPLVTLGGVVVLAMGLWHTLTAMRRLDGPVAEPGAVGDWDASVWDPGVLDDIERRRGRA